MPGIMGKTEDQFVKYTYPAPGCSEMHLIWTDSPCWLNCWNDGNRFIEALRSPKIEFMLAQHPWMENDCLLADIILPVNTKFEEEDRSADSEGQFHSIYLEKVHRAVGRVEKRLRDSLSDRREVRFVEGIYRRQDR